VAETGEACDGSDLSGATCAGEGFGGGVLACDGNCQLDTSGCDPCGNDTIDGAEQCDGIALDGESCVSQGFVSGALSCAADCTFDTAGCSSCGDDVADTGEACDGTDLAGEDCASQGFVSGTLACSTDCTFDTTSCASCTETSAGVLTVPLDLIVLMDRSGSMSGSKWSGSVAALTQFFNEPASDGISAALSFFPPAGSADECLASSYNPPQVPVGQLSAYAPTLISALNATVPGGLTPTYGGLLGSLQFATAHKDLNPSHAVVVVLVTDGDPTSCDTSVPNIAGLAASAFNYNSVITHAVAIQGSTVANLNTIAAAGGGQVFDVTIDISLFGQAMAQIRDTNLACEFGIPAGVTDPALLNIDFVPDTGPTQRLGRADNLADCGNAAGWYYDDPTTPTSIVLCPVSCSTFQLDPNPELGAVVGCSSVLN